MNRKLLIFIQLFKRDIYIHFKRIKHYLINFGCIYPLLYSLCFGYIQPHVYFDSMRTGMGTLLLSGNILLPIMVISFNLTIDLLYDLDNKRLIEYHISILDPRLVILERIIFRTLFTFMMVLLFFPISKLLLWHRFDTNNTSWIQLTSILFIGSLCSVAYHQLAACILKNPRNVSQLWMRWNILLLVFGGFFFPWYALLKFSKVLAYIMLANPFIYITEGARQALIGGHNFIPFSISASGLTVLSIIFIPLTWYFFKKRTDHI